MKLFDGDVDWHNQSLWFVRSKRDLSSKSIDEWESLRELASNIKSHTISHLDRYLVEFEENALKNGIQLYWAEDSDEHNKIVESILKSKNAKKIIKSKSMLTEECGLNHYLQKRGYEVIDTDLGERIVQLNNQPPSHIVLPAIHLKKEQISDIFGESYSDPVELTEFARRSLREDFESSDVAITGVNFAVASEGLFVVCTNEGNADLGTSLTDTHIACMGIEKIIPSMQDLGVFTRILARSATGQAITTYTSHFKKPDKNKEIHLIIVDNGRSKMIQNKRFALALKCIRCGACMNSCPIYRRSGGHNYSYTIPGPIGSILGSSKDIKEYGDLAFASTLCGSCTDVCPVKIDIHDQLLAYRSEYKKVTNEPKDKFYKFGYLILKHPRVFKIATKIASFVPHKLYKNAWGEGRIAPKVAKQSFRDMWDEL